MSKLSQRISRAISITLLSLAVFSTGDVQAQDPAFDLSAPQIVKSSLDKLIGKTVIIRLKNGEDLQGTVKEVGATGVQLTELSGREFFDALVPLESVVAIVVRAKSK